MHHLGAGGGLQTVAQGGAAAPRIEGVLADTVRSAAGSHTRAERGHAGSLSRAGGSYHCDPRLRPVGQICRHQAPATLMRRAARSMETSVTLAGGCGRETEPDPVQVSSTKRTAGCAAANASASNDSSGGQYHPGVASAGKLLRQLRQRLLRRYQQQLQTAAVGHHRAPAVRTPGSDRPP